MPALVVVGAQWGDEGKGKVVDALAASAQGVARFAGGNNAGHTLVVDGAKVVTHLVPSGCLYPGTRCLLGAGMVVDPNVLAQEIEQLRQRGRLLGDELTVSLQAHVIFPFHRELDGLREDRAGSGALGTTRRGIGPAYEAKAARRGIQVRDLFDSAYLRQRLQQCGELLAPELQALGATFDVEHNLEVAAAWARWLEPMACDTGAQCQELLKAGQNLLIEGAQGALLDLDHGTYPFVTSSTTTAGGACAGLGIGPVWLDEIWGITKAYTTRVGAGPFPTRLGAEAAQRLRVLGQEVGATTGRPRDCGWLDLPALRYAARINGMTGLCVTKLDVLAALGRAEICTRYADGREPGRDRLELAVPELESVPGFDAPDLADRLRAATNLATLPSAVRAFLDRVAEACEVPISLVSLGPGREQTILLAEPFKRKGHGLNPA